MIQVIYSCVLAGGFWLVMFSPWTRQAVNFWAVMGSAAAVLAGLGLYHSRRDLSVLMRFRPVHLLAGLAAAAALYGVFLLGHTASTALFDFAGPQVDWIYTLRIGAPRWLIFVLLVVLIAPAEEVFWRGFVQHRLARRFGRWQGYLIAAGLYALVHVWAMNAMLLAAALVCGLFWGALKLGSRSLWPAIISHVLWDVTIFVLLPIH